MTALMAALPRPEARAFIIMRASSRGSGMYRTWKPPGKRRHFNPLTFLYPSACGALSVAMEIAYDTARSLSDSIQILPSPGETLSYEIKTLSARRFKIKRQSNLTMT
ncbi:hypothetical protein LQ252_04250 [Klebsiella variicola]|uniref:hypothetical protein n=1 Tax=Klebsiella variicola TaxID=244366 RepID=UPI00311F051C